MKYLELAYDGFDWDDFNSPKVKARVSLEDMESFFRQKILVREDTRHSFSEKRFIAMGEVHKRCLFVAFTVRKRGDEMLVRVISGRYVHTRSKEREAYEKAKKAFLQEKD